MRVLTETAALTARALRESIRQPANELGNVFIPLFFLAVTTGAIGGIASGAFGVENFLAFQMPIAVLQGVASTAGSAGLGMTQDIQRGYLDKLLLTSTPRFTLVFGRMAGDAIRGVLLTAFILAVGLAFGSGFATGPLGVLVLVAGGGLFALAYSGIGVAIALRTGSPQAAQVGFLLFFPLLFLAPTFAPKEVFSDWLEVAATVNPVTYVVEGMRGLVLDGWDGPELLRGLLAIAGIGTFTMALSALAFRWRTS